MGSIMIAILVTSVVLFFASFVAWTILPHHRPDYIGHPKEKEFLEQINASEVPPGQYVFPFVDPAEYKNPDKLAVYNAGPWGTFNLWKGKPSMGRNMFFTWLTFFIACSLIAWLCNAAIGTGKEADFSKVFQITGITGLCTWCFAFIPNAIWFGKPARAIAMDVLDGFAYGILTGLSFGLLWPGGG